MKRRDFLKALGVIPLLPVANKLIGSQPTPLFKGELGQWDGMTIHGADTLTLADIERARRIMDRQTTVPYYLIMPDESIRIV